MGVEPSIRLWPCGRQSGRELKVQAPSNSPPRAEGKTANGFKLFAFLDRDFFDIHGSCHTSRVFKMPRLGIPSLHRRERSVRRVCS